MSHWKAVINGRELEVELEDGSYRLDRKPLLLDVQQINPGEYSVIMGNRSYRVEEVLLDREEKRCILKVNGNEYEVELKDKMDLLLQKMGINHRSTHTTGSLRAPMPGKVLRVDVKEGQTVKKGEPILILEAMKMENAIKSPGEAVIKTIRVKVGDAVEKGTIMVEMQ